MPEPTPPGRATDRRSGQSPPAAPPPAAPPSLAALLNSEDLLFRDPFADFIPSER